MGIFELSGDLRFDGLGAMAIGLMLGGFSLLLLWGVKDLLVGRSAAPELEREIQVEVSS